MIFSKSLLLSKTKKKGTGWNIVGNNPDYNSFDNIHYSSVYNGFILNYSDGIALTSNFKDWNKLSGKFGLDTKSGYYYKTIAGIGFGSSRGASLSICKMTSWNVFDKSILLESVPSSSYSSVHDYRPYVLGNYLVCSYSTTMSPIYGRYSCSQKLAYSSDRVNWSTINIFSEENVSYGHDQQTPLGCDGDKYVLLASTPDGFRPRVFTSPTQYTTGDAIWQGGNMTGSSGFYMNNVWYYSDFGYQGRASLKSKDGFTFEYNSLDYINSQMIYVNGKYITNYTRNETRLYNATFDDYIEINAPCDYFKYLLGLHNQTIYACGNDNIIYSTPLDNIFKS